MYLVKAREMQEMDRETIESFGIPGRVLMENAGRGTFKMIVDLFPDIASKKVCVLCGRGNNGGDGFVVARYLMEKGVETDIFLLSSRDRLRGDARANMSLVEKLCAFKKKEGGENRIIQIPDREAFLKYKARIIHSDLFVDGIFGTGLNSDVRGFFRDIIDLVNLSNRPVISIDIPSGLNADTGKPCGVSIKAFATASFAFAKPGHILYPGNEFTGKLEVIDIGIPGFIVKKKSPLLHVTKKALVKSFFVPRNSQAHKGNFGHLFIVAGSIGKTGAAALASNAAMACGTGLVTLGIPESLNSVMEPQVVEPMTFPLSEGEKGFLSENSFNQIVELSKGKTAIAIGPGIGTKESTEKLVKRLITAIDIPMILDADALNVIAGDIDILKEKKASVILTPHPGEMARLMHCSTAEIQANRLEIAQNFAMKFDVILVLKGAGTITAMPDGRAFICTKGNSGMASGGMGDALTGIISGFTAQGFSSENAAIAGPYIHGLCGDVLACNRGKFGFTASDMVDIIPETIYEKLYRKNTLSEAFTDSMNCGI